MELQPRIEEIKTGGKTNIMTDSPNLITIRPEQADKFLERIGVVLTSKK